MNSRKREAYEWLIYSHIFLGFCLASLPLQPIYLGHLTTPWPLILLIFSTTIFTYTLHNLLRQKEKATSPRYHNRLRWIKTHKKTIAVILFSTCLTDAICVSLTPLRYTLPLMGIGLISLSYSLPIFRWISPKHPRLRDIPYIKLFIVVSSITAMAVLIPIIDHATWGLLALRLWLFIAAITLLFDLRDRDFDRTQNLPTLATLCSETQIKRISLGLLILSEIVTLIQTNLGQITPSQSLILGLSLLPTAYFITQSSSQKSGLFYGGWVEGCLLLQSLLLFLTQ